MMKSPGKPLSSLPLIAMLVVACSLLLAHCLVGQEKPGWMELGSRVEASEIPVSQYAALAAWLDSNGRSPLEYVIEKCRTHQIVIFGEPHGVKDYMDLFLQLIPEAYHRAGMRYVILEAAKFEDNEKIARLVESESFDGGLALEIARNGGWSTWNHKEYWDVFEVVWRLNRSLPAGAQPMKVIGMCVSADMQWNWMLNEGKLKNPALIAQAERESLLLDKHDALMAAAIEMTVLREGSKGIVWVGYNHAFTHYGQPWVTEDGLLFGEFQRMGRQLYQIYGDRIFQIAFHCEFDSPRLVFDDYEGPEPVFSGMIEKIMALRKDQPVGWDVFNSPFGQIRDKHSYYFHFQPRMQFGDLCRGFVYLKPLKQLAGCQKIKDFITEAMFQKYKAYYEAQYERTFGDAKELNAWREED
ncbi:MAG: hypothetical protein AB1714_09830 [Acidobacteriota bacterium]